MNNVAGSSSAVNRDKSPVVNVYIWDMDETLILLKSLLNGSYAEAFNGSKDVKMGMDIGKTWETHILDVCDEYFFYQQIENYNKPNIDALRQYDDGRDLSNYDFNRDGFNFPIDDDNKRKLAYRHRSIAHKYKQGLHSFCTQQIIKHLDELYEMTDKYTDGWLSSARVLLEECSSVTKVSSSGLVSVDGTTSHSDTTYEHINILVTSGSLIPSLVKCLLFRLDKLFPHGNVYSSWEVGKLQCFHWIRERFSSQNVRFCVLGDGLEECEAAEVMRWPFVKIDPRPGSSHRFPGLTLRTIGFYYSVVYGDHDTESDPK